MSTSYEDFLVEVTPFVRDVPEVVAVQAVRNACIEFCTRTRYLQTDLDPITAIAHQAEYDMDADTGYIVVDIMQAWFGDQLLIPKAVEELTRIYRTTDWQTLDGNPYYYYRNVSQQMRLVPRPKLTEANKIRIRAAIAPSRSSTTVDSDIYEQFLEYIALGARARLYDTANQPYYDPKAAQVYLKRFRDAISEVRTRINKGMTRAAPQIEFQRFV
jgi:hypothetical protein